MGARANSEIANRNGQWAIGSRQSAATVEVTVRLIHHQPNDCRLPISDCPFYSLIRYSPISRPHLPGTLDPVLEAGELLDADRTAGVEAAGGDADLGAHAEL